MWLEYTNSHGGSVRFAAPDDTAYTPYWLTEISGIHGVDVDNYGVKLLTGDGEVYVGSDVKPRRIRLGGLINGAGTAHKRIRLLETMIPNEIGRLKLVRGAFVRGIGCVIAQAPSFSKPRGDEFTLELICHNPYWEDEIGINDVRFVGILNLFKFPLSIPQPTQDDPMGFVFGRMQSVDTLVIANNGQIETGFVWRSVILDAVDWISLLKVNSGETMRLDAALSVGDALTVSTVTRDKYVTITRADGAIENGIRLITPDWSFFLLNPGVNTIKINTSAGSTAQDGGIMYRSRYLGV